MNENTKQLPWVDKLLDLVIKFLDFQNTLIDQSPLVVDPQAIAAEFLDFLKRSDESGIYSPKALAAIGKIHSRIQKNSAQLEKIHEETNTKAINNRIMDFRLALEGIRFSILINNLGDANEEDTGRLIKEIEKFEKLLSQWQPPIPAADPT